LASILEINMAYQSIFKTREKERPTSGGYVSIFSTPTEPITETTTEPITPKEERTQQVKNIQNELIDSGQATTEPIGSIPAGEKRGFFEPTEKTRVRDFAREFGSLLAKPFKAVANQIKEEKNKTPEQKAKEEAVKSLAGYNGKVFQKREAERINEGTSLATYKDLAEFTKEAEIKQEKISKFLTAPVRFTAGDLAKAVTAYSLEKANSNDFFDPRTDTEKLLVGEGRIQRLTEQEDLYGIIARGIGIPASLATMVLIENPFMKSTGIGSIIKKKLYQKVTREAGQQIIRLGAEELSKIADDVIKAEKSAGKITKEEAVKATSEISKMKKTKPPIKKVGKVKEPITKEIQKAKAEGKSFDEFVGKDIVYHGTSAENATKISQEGFKAGAGKGVSGQGSTDFIYATGNKPSANKYVSERLGIKNPTVVEGNFSGKVLEIQGKMADFEAFGEASKKLGVPLGIGSQGKPTMLDMPAIQKAMRERGYSAIGFSDRYANGSKAFAILPDKIKTKSQLKQLWDKPAKAKPIRTIPLDKVDARKKITTEKVTTEPAIPKRIENQAIEKGLVDNFGDIPDRDIINFKDQAKLVGDIIDEDPAKAVRIALGKELPTNGALPESVFIAVKNQALKNGDIDLLRRLATEEGGVATEASILGARIKMLDEGLKDDAFKNINKLVKERRKVFEKKGVKVSKAKKAEIKKIKDTIKKPDKHDWNAFISSIRC